LYISRAGCDISKNKGYSRAKSRARVVPGSCHHQLGIPKMNTAKTAKSIQAIENRGITLKIKGDKLNVKAPSRLSEKQVEFLKTHKQEIIQYLNYRESANEDIPSVDGKIDIPGESPFNAKKTFLFIWLCRKAGIEPDAWESLGTDKQLEFQTTVNIIYHSLVNDQCQKCGHFKGKWECTDMNGFQIVCEEWDPRLVDWRSCPLSTETSEELDDRLGQ
jgi:hypothetical protein